MELENIGGNYGTHSRFCGVHVEVNQEEVIITGIHNSMRPYLSCGDLGQTVVYDCEQADYEFGWCIRTSPEDYKKCHKIKILEDGNILSQDSCGREVSIIKYIKAD